MRRAARTADLAPDGGWGWAVLAGVMVVNIVVLGHCKSFGVYFVAIMDHFGSSPSQVAWIQALQISTFSLASPVASICAGKLGARNVALFGGFLACLGLVWSSAVPSATYLYFTYGVIEGVASGLVFTSGVVMIGKYFDKRRGLANGLAMAGNSVGGMLIPIVADLLMEHYGLRGALLIMGGILLNGCVGIMLWQPVEWHLIKGSLETSSSLEDQTYDTEITYDDTSQNVIEFSKKCNSLDSFVTKPVLSHTYSVEFLSKENKSTNVSENLPLNGDIDSLHKCGSMSLSFESSTSIPNLNELTKRKDFETISKASSFLYLNTFHAGPTSSTVLTSEHMKPPDEKEEEEAQSMIENEALSSCSESKVQESSSFRFRCPLRKIIDFSIFSNPVFYVLTWSMMCHYFSYPGTQMFLPLRATNLGLNQAQAASSLSTLAFADLLGRIGCAWLSDFHLFPRKYWFIFGIFLAGVAAICLQLPQEYASLLVCSASFGLASGAYIGLTVVLFADAFGSNKVALGYSMSNMACGFVTVSGPPLMGYILERTGSYGICQTILGAIQILGAAVWIFEPWAVRHQKKKALEQENQE